MTNSDLLRPEIYYSPEVARLESQKLWPKVWMIACREQEVEKVGQFVVFDIDKESIIVLRSSETEVKAFYNVCQHRGRRLLNGCGKSGPVIFCPFHGWRWNRDGSINHVVGAEDYEGVPGHTPEALALKEVRFDRWGGWIWVNMDPDAPDLLEYLSPLPEYLDHYEIENTRIAWHQTIVFPVNWKTILNAFNEAYHVEATHPQFLRFGVPKSASAAHGHHHGHFFYPPVNKAAPTAFVQKFDDLRDQIRAREYERYDLLHALISPATLRAADRLVSEKPGDESVVEIQARYRKLHREEVERIGARWPENLTDADIARAGINWHIFPNQIVLPTLDGAQWYRARPNGDDPESCIYDVWWLERYGPGGEPPINHEFYPDIASFTGKNPFLEQDFDNLIACQAGMHSRGFQGMRDNPVQEAAVRAFHRGVEEYLYGDDAGRN